MAAADAVREVPVRERAIADLLADAGDGLKGEDAGSPVSGVVYHVTDGAVCGAIRGALLEIDGRQAWRRKMLPRRDHEFWRGEQLRRAIAQQTTWRHEDADALVPRHKLDPRYRPCVRGAPLPRIRFVRSFHALAADRPPARPLPAAQPVPVDESHIKTMWSGAHMMGLALKPRGVFFVLVFGTFFGQPLAALVDRAWRVHLVRAPAPAALHLGTVLTGELVRLRAGGEAVFIASDAQLVCGVSVLEYAHLVRLQAAALALDAWRQASRVHPGSEPVEVLFRFDGVLEKHAAQPPATVEVPGIGDVPWTGYHPVSPTYAPTAAPGEPALADALSLSQAARSSYTPPLSPTDATDYNPTSPPPPLSLPPPSIAPPRLALDAADADMPAAAADRNPTSPSPAPAADDRNPTSPAAAATAGDRHRDWPSAAGTAERAPAPPTGVGATERARGWPFGVRAAAFYRAGDAGALLADAVPALDYAVESLLLVQIDGRAWFELRAQQGCDFYVDVMGRGRARLLVVDGGAWVPWCVQEWSDADAARVQPAGCVRSVQDLHGRIVKCVLADGKADRWMPTVVRAGKRTPNSLHTVLTAVRAHIHPVALCDHLPREVAPLRRDALETADRARDPDFGQRASAMRIARPAPRALYPLSAAELIAADLQRAARPRT